MEAKDKLNQKQAMAEINKYIWTILPMIMSCTFISYNYAPWQIPDLPNAMDRVIYTIQWHGISLAVLWNMLENVMGERSRSAWNPLDPNTKSRTEVLSRILANTLEQFVLFFGATIVLSTYLTSAQMKLIPTLVIQWCFARLLFEYGYKIHPIYRGPGFAGTAIPTLISLTLISYFQFFQGPWILSLISGYFAVKRILEFLLHNECSPLRIIKSKLE